MSAVFDNKRQLFDIITRNYNIFNTQSSEPLEAVRPKTDISHTRELGYF